MSDKDDNLNKDDENIQFENVSQQNQDTSDRSSKKGTAPLKDLPASPSSSPVVSDDSPDDQSSATENSTGDEILDVELDDPSDDTQLYIVNNDTDDKDEKSKAELTEQSSREEPDDAKDRVKAETDESDVQTDKPDDSKQEKSEDTPGAAAELLDKKVEKSTDETLVTKPRTSRQRASEEKGEEDQADSTDSSTDAEEIRFEPETTEKPQTVVRRSTFDPLSDKDSFLTFHTKKDDDALRKNPDTAILPNESASWRKVIDGQSQGTTSTLGEQREVLFVIRGMIERVVMKDNSSVTLGRFDTGTVPNEEIDLIPYGAIDRGVSRRHCKIQLKDNLLYVTDLQSTNGTFLAGVLLNPNEETVLRKGDELLLGRLAVQVLFR